LAHAAIECGGNDPTALSLAALPLSYLGREHHEALSAVERSLSLNPNGAAAWNAAGYIRLNLGRVDEAAESFRRAIRLSPIDPELYRTQCGLALAHLLAKRFDEAIEEGTRALSVNPAYPTTKRVLASAYANLGKLDEAKRIVQRILAVEPGLTLTVLRHRSPAFGPAGEHYFSGLLRAGLLE
jgi:tetratricopeptide (TPR) repeat protein